MHYIRFAKWPYIYNARSIRGSFTITTDLGETFLANSCNLEVVVKHCSSGHILYKQRCQWIDGQRESKFDWQLSSPLTDNLDQVQVQLRQWPDTRISKGQLQIDPVMAATVLLPMDDTHERTVQRELIFSNGHSLTIFEDGNFSIARHIWDAGLVFSQALVAVITSSHKGLGSIKEVLSQCEDGIIQIIELGSGCGLVGLATAWHLPRCSVLLTDLEDAREMVLKNLAANPPPNPSAVDFRVLEWGEPLPEKLAKAAFDLVLITDCTYNPDSAAALVSTISGLTASNPRCLIVVAMKIRHQSEEIFFQLIDEARLVEVQKQSFPSPHLGDLEEGEIIEVHCYRLRPDV